ncbi:hypothetical protein TNCT_692501 [Trichonephila clavata]|uniref:Uncharacterized protein n=1 Tax=Trichonephila clavata TaxID=2740835 RepID=A0A8X6KSW2_TRICU|nr:hypothetical protein TNCT_692501 [Trichonephila clavata]
MPFTEPKGVTNSECIHLDFVTDCLGRILFFFWHQCFCGQSNRDIPLSAIPFPRISNRAPGDVHRKWSSFLTFPGSFTAEKQFLLVAASLCTNGWIQSHCKYFPLHIPPSSNHGRILIKENGGKLSDPN